MGSIGTGYDLSASIYSPDGRVFQVEYAQKAIDNSGTAIGIKVADGVVLAVEKVITSKLLRPGANPRIMAADEHVAVAASGLVADARHIVGRAREEAVNYRGIYKIPIPLKYLADRLGMYVQMGTLYSSLRPFGCCSILGSYDALDGPSLHMIEPSGLRYGYSGVAAGKSRQLAQTELEKLDLPNLGLDQALNEAAKILEKCHEEAKDKAYEIEAWWVGKATDGRALPVGKERLDQAVAWAKQALQDEMED